MWSRSEVPSAPTTFVIIAKLSSELNRLEKQLARAARIAQQEKFEHLDRRVARPLVNRHAAADRLRDLAAFLVEKHLERKSQRRLRAQHAHNLSREPRRVGEILAVQFVVDLEHVPSQRPIDLPLHLRLAAEHRLLAAKTASRPATRALFAG